jgi:hypothetical protein
MQNQFTLIDAFKQFWTICEFGERQTLSHVGLTYFYLCHVWNSTGRSASFRRLNTIICAELVISKPTLVRHREILKSAGLISFSSKGKGDANITYQILDARLEKVERMEEVTREVIPVVTEKAISEGMPEGKESLFVIIAGEKRNLRFLREIFEDDGGLQEYYRQNGLPTGEFSDALKKWMIRNNGAAYEDLRDARKHFLFWMPNYQLSNGRRIDSKYKMLNGKTVGKRRNTDADYAEGL